MWGGALADAKDRRRLVIGAELGALAITTLLLANSQASWSRLWPLFVLATATAALNAFRRPSLEALVPMLVPREEVAAAGAIRSLFWTTGAVVGPIAAGLLIGRFGVGSVFVAQLATFCISLPAYRALGATPPPPNAERASLRSVIESFRFARSQPVLMGTYLVDFNAMIFGVPTAVFPALAETRFGGPEVLGLLYAAPYAGSLIASATSGWTSRIHRHGRAVILGAGAWGAAILAFGFSNSLVLSLILLAVAGGADMVSGIFRMTIWNQTIPQRLRGRLAGIEFANVAGGPAIGDFEAGVVAELTSVKFSIVSGGIACLAGTALLAWRLPEFLRYDSRRSVS